MDIKIFVASSGELSTERDKCVSVIHVLNKSHSHLRLEVVKWETDLESGSYDKSRIQDEINPLLEDCQIVIVMFYSKVGKFTIEEYLLARKKTKKIFLYFKQGFSPKNPKEHTSYGEVIQFKQAIIEECQTLYQDFITLDKFESILYRDLNKYLTKEYPTTYKQNTIITPFPKNIETFIGREEDLAEVHKLLQQKNTLLLMNGLGGVGKTTLAIEYVNRYREKYDHLIWLDFKNTFRESFLNLYQDLHIDISGGTEKELYHQLRAQLRECPGNCLIVIDNFNNLDEVKELRSLLPNFKKFLTSRNEISSGFVHTRYLDTLPREKAIELFRTHYKTPIDEKLLDKFLKIIGDHTLTIEISARTLAKSSGHISLEEIYNIFKEKKFDTPAGKIKAPTDYQNKLLQINNFLDELFNVADFSKAQLSILQNFSILPAVFIDNKIVTEMLGIKDEEYPEFIGNLDDIAEGGWLTRTEAGIKCHQIIQQLIFNKYPPEYEIIEPVIVYLANQLFCEPGESPLDKADWVVFADTVLSNIAFENNDIARLYNNLALRFNDIGKMEKALEFALKDLKISEKILSSDHPSLATSYNNLATIYKAMGELEKALEFALKSTQISEKILAPDHPNLATSYNNLAQIYHDMGKLDKALEFALKDFKISEKILAPDHPTLATSYNNLAMIYRDMGDLKKALEFVLKDLKIIEKIVAPDHPDLATSYNNLATIYQDMGETEKARKYYNKSIDILERIFPKGHPNIATVRKNLELLDDDS